MASARRAVTLAASADEVWELVGDFNGLPKWLPPAAASVLEEGGQVRRLTVADGSGEVVERLEARDPDARTTTYAILESPLPVSGYVATLAVHERDRGCEVEWQSTFQPSGAGEDEAVAVIHGIYDEGLGALQERFGTLQ